MSFHRIVPLLTLAWAGLPSGPLAADLVRLKTGGEIRGQLLEGDAAAREAVTLRSLSGALVELSSDVVDFVKRRSPLVEEYISRSRSLPETVAARWELAEWCRLNQLSAERREQLELILDLDADHAESRKLLGYVFERGRWILHDDLMTSRGLVKHKGRWITQQEMELIEQSTALREAERNWAPKIRLWLGWITGSNSQRHDEGWNALRAIRDPDAVGPLTLQLGRHTAPEARLLLVDILSQTPGPRPVKPLVERLLHDPAGPVRSRALAAIQGERAKAALPTLLAALRHESNTVVCRAAEALGTLGDERAVAPLIEALVTRHAYRVLTPDDQAMTFSGSNGRAVSPNARIFSGIVPPEIEVLSRTGQLPYGFSLAPGPLAAATPMKTVTVKIDVKNQPVLAALERLTGKNFGFNQRDWQLWWALEKG